MTMIEPPHTEGMCLRQPATEPLYDAKSEEEIFSELSERLGVLGLVQRMVNMICGFDHNPNLMLERDKQVHRQGDRASARACCGTARISTGTSSAVTP